MVKKQRAERHAEMKAERILRRHCRLKNGEEHAAVGMASIPEDWQAFPSICITLLTHRLYKTVGEALKFIWSVAVGAEHSPTGRSFVVMVDFMHANEDDKATWLKVFIAKRFYDRLQRLAPSHQLTLHILPKGFVSVTLLAADPTGEDATRKRPPITVSEVAVHETFGQDEDHTHLLPEAHRTLHRPGR